MPAKPVIADVHHPVFLVPRLERPFPHRIVGMKQKGTDIRPQRMKCWLEDLVGETIAKFDPLSTRLRVQMIEIASNMDRIVVHSVTIDDYPSLSGYSAQQPEDIQVTDSHESIFQ